MTRKLKAIVIDDYDFTANTMPVLRALNYCGSFPIPDKSKKPIYSEIFFDSKNSLLEAEQKRNRKKLNLVKSSLGGRDSY